MADILYVTSDPAPSLPPEFVRGTAGQSAAALVFNGTDEACDLPPGWTRLKPDDLLDAQALRRQFLDFLETWPTLAVKPGRTFDEVFTVDGRHSVWWTSVGADRQATHGKFKYFRAAALLDRAIAVSAPRRVVLFTEDRLLAALVRSRAAHSGIPLALQAGCARPAPETRGVGRQWCVRSARHALLSPLSHLRAALRCRWDLRRARVFRRSRRPTIVFASRFDRYLEIRNGEFSPVNWREICQALRAVEPNLHHAFLPRRLADVVDRDAVGGSGRRGVDAVRATRAPLLVREQYYPLRGRVSSIGRQIAATWRFRNLARRDDFRRSCRFARTDMSVLLMPDLKRAIAQVVDWSFKSGQFRCALRAAGRVRAVVVAEEMYAPSMPILAAAAALGLPTIGVQHGTLMPAHLVYTVPRGHVRHAPIPDYFAAYGEYARETLSVHGAYPSDRVWITGAARLDPLVTRPVDPSAARSRLGLPSGKRIVVLATQTFPWFALAIRAVLEALRDRPDAVLCVKKHPSSRAMSLEAIAALARQVGVEDVRGFTGDIDLLLASSDVWISASSTTILEATLIGKATICVNFSGEPDGYPYVEDGASLPARSIDELQQSLSAALGSSQAAEVDRRRAFLARHAGPTIDGRAAITFAQRVAGLVSREAIG